MRWVSWQTKALVACNSMEPSGLRVCVLLVRTQPSGHMPFPNLRGNEGLNCRVWPLILCVPQAWATHSQPLERGFATLNGWVQMRMPGCHQIKGQRKAAWRTWPLALVVEKPLSWDRPNWKEVDTPVSQATLIRASDLVAPWWQVEPTSVILSYETIPGKSPARLWVAPQWLVRVALQLLASAFQLSCPLLRSTDVVWGPHQWSVLTVLPLHQLGSNLAVLCCLQMCLAICFVLVTFFDSFLVLGSVGLGPSS